MFVIPWRQIHLVSFSKGTRFSHIHCSISLPGHMYREPRLSSVFHLFNNCELMWEFFFLLPQKPQSKLSWLGRKFEHMANCTAGPNPEAREQSVCVCVCVFYGEPRATGLEADWDMSQTPSCQRCNSIPEETWIDAVNSTSDKSSLELVNFTSRAWTL